MIVYSSLLSVEVLEESFAILGDRAYDSFLFRTRPFRSHLCQSK